MLRLQTFTLEIVYSKGIEIHNADPFSKAYLPSTNQNEEVKEDAWNVSDMRSPTEVEAEHMKMAKFGPANSSSNFVRNTGC